MSEIEKLLESANNILRNSVVAKDGESDIIDDWITDYNLYQTDKAPINERPADLINAIKQAWVIIDGYENENADDWQNKYEHFVFE